jgi:pSer/pThr/pTyr-binding forkhead associated (FHA) protein
VEIRSRGVLVGSSEFRGGTTRVGRGTDNEIVLHDERVSRHHGQLTARQGTIVYSDLGSTNGSFVNGTRVREIVLGSGDVVRLGNSTLTILHG